MRTSGFRLIQLSLLLWILSGVSAVCQDQTNLPPALRVKSLLQMSVESFDGHDIGKIRNVLLDAEKGTVRFVLLAPDGILAGRSQIRAVPPQCVSSATAKRGVVSIHVTQQKWNNAPVIRPRDIATLGRAERAEQMYRYFAVEEERPAAVVIRSAGDGERLTPTGRTNANASGISTRTLLATDLIGNTVFNRDREKVGEVLDLLAAFHEQTPVYVLITTMRGFGDRRQTYAVPLRTLQIDQAGQVTVNWNRDGLLNAPWFTETTTATANINPARLFRYRLPN